MSSTTSTPLRVALVGASITGNRGAESMLRAALELISHELPNVEFSLLSLYPREDARENDHPALTVVPCSPLELVLGTFPSAVLSAAGQRLGITSRRWRARPSVQALADADLVIDLSGISFVDGRGYGILLYNVLLVLIPSLLGTPVLKYSQALGPFETRINRLLARRLLPKVAKIASRGRITHAFLEGLGLSAEQVTPCADAAFAMKVDSTSRERAAPWLAHAAFERDVVAVSVSSVVDAYCRRHDIDYLGMVVAFIDYLVEDRGYGVLLVAHSSRPGEHSEKNNDLPACERVLARCRVADRVCFPEGAVHADAWRVLIGACRFLVASRFHAMISGLAMGVPSLLVGWSHKYAEVLEAFELERFALDYAALSPATLRRSFEQLEEEETTVREAIARHLPEVMRSSADNARLAVELLTSAL